MPDVPVGIRRRKSSGTVGKRPSAPTGLTLSTLKTPNPGSIDFRIKYVAAAVPLGSPAVIDYKIFVNGVHRKTVPFDDLEPTLGADVGITPSTSYTISVRARNSIGDSLPSGDLVVTTLAASTPSTPAAPSIANVTPTSMTVSWAADPAATSFTLQRSTSPTTGFSTVYTGPALTFNATGLSASTVYYFRVSATNAAGSSAYSANGQATTGTTGVNTITPYSSDDVWQSYGACAHPTRADLVYAGNGSGSLKTANIDAWMKILGDNKISFFRGFWSDTHAGATRAIAQADLRGIKMGMLLCPESDAVTSNTVAETTALVNAIAKDPVAARVCRFIEGINEPNHNRSGNPVVSNWAAITVSHQNAIWAAVKDTTLRRADTGAVAPGGYAGATYTNAARLAGVKVIGPSLNDKANDQSYNVPSTAPSASGARHWDQLYTAGLRFTGVGQNADYCGLHTYPGGNPPTYKLVKDATNYGRATYIRDAFGASTPIWATEWGYHNALSTTLGHKPASEAAAATYAMRGLFQLYAIGVVCTRYELLDDYDPNPKSDVEANFGLERVSSTSALSSFDSATWNEKPELTKLRAGLAKLYDPGASPHVPTPVVCAVNVGTATDIDWWVTQKRDGTATFWYCRKATVWNPNTLTAISVPAKQITLTDSLGDRTIDVGPEVQWVDLR